MGPGLTIGSAWQSALKKARVTASGKRSRFRAFSAPEPKTFLIFPPHAISAGLEESFNAKAYITLTGQGVGVGLGPCGLLAQCCVLLFCLKVTGGLFPLWEPTCAAALFPVAHSMALRD